MFEDNQAPMHRIDGALHFSLYHESPQQLHLAVLRVFTGEANEPQTAKLFNNYAYLQAGFHTSFHLFREPFDHKELDILIHITAGRMEVSRMSLRSR